MGEDLGGAVLFRFSAELRRYATEHRRACGTGPAASTTCWPGSRPHCRAGLCASGNVTGAFESWRVLDTPASGRGHRTRSGGSNYFTSHLNAGAKTRIAGWKVEIARADSFTSSQATPGP